MIEEKKKYTKEELEELFDKAKKEALSQLVNDYKKATDTSNKEVDPMGGAYV